MKFWILLFAILAVPSKSDDSVPMKMCREAQLDSAVAAIDGMLTGLQPLESSMELPVGVIRSMLNNSRQAIIAEKRKR